MKRTLLFNIGLGFLLVIILSACGSPDLTSGEDLLDAVSAGVSATLTQEYLDSVQEEVVPTDTVMPSDTPEPEIVHVDFPAYSSGSNTFVTDISSLDYAPEKSTVGDFFQMNRLERPFSAGEMEYFPDLDITRVDLKADTPWFYATFILAGDLRDEGNINYAIELDLDADGRGDFLIWAALPPDTEWTTDGVQVLEDADNDVGGVFPLHMEDPNPDLNGYEEMVFDNGLGEDPDLAWIRRDPEETAQIQIAFKDSITGSTGFLWSAWADGGLMDPEMFDYNDRFTFDDAGSPNNENLNYPVKLVELVDSTCRSWYGMTPVGNEPGLCGTVQTGEPGDGGPRRGFCVMAISRPGCAGPCLPSCTDPPCISCTLP